MPYPYEQAVLGDKGKIYYSVELYAYFAEAPPDWRCGHVPDVTSLKEEMKRKQQRLKPCHGKRRLISLGQMIGSNIPQSKDSHHGNLRRCKKALDNLVKEYYDSIGDPEVTPRIIRRLPGK